MLDSSTHLPFDADNRRQKEVPEEIDVTARQQDTAPRYEIEREGTQWQNYLGPEKGTTGTTGYYFDPSEKFNKNEGNSFLRFQCWIKQKSDV